MKNEDLKKKIIEIVAPYVSAWGDDERIADALIAAGIGFDKSHLTTFQELDTKLRVAEHRAEVAERALEERATYCAMEGFDYFSLTTVAVEARAKELYNGWVQQAEKDLAKEEQK